MLLKTLFVLSVLSLNSLAHANSQVALLMQTKTLIRNHTISYTIRNTDGTITEKQSEFFEPMTSSLDCTLFENSSSYSDFELVTITEEPKRDDPTFNQWVEGVRINGQVIKRETQLCFAIEKKI